MKIVNFRLFSLRLKLRGTSAISDALMIIFTILIILIGYYIYRILLIFNINKDYNNINNNIITHKQWLDAWLVTGSAKIVLSVNNEIDLINIERNSINSGVPVYIVRDTNNINNNINNN
eukprot:Tbor_TRINITY_DN5198_c7_g1::TRINITY_DN5198_c7_g1_i1::g.25672::m.25672